MRTARMRVRQRPVEIEKAAAHLLKVTETALAREDIAPAMRACFRQARRVAGMVLEAKAKPRQLRLAVTRLAGLTDGLAGATAVIAQELEPTGTTFPGLERMFCMAKCLKAYNECMGRDGDIGDDDESDPGQAETPEGDDDDLGDFAELGCQLNYASCLAECMPAVSV